MKTIKTFISVKKVADIKLFKIDHKRYSKMHNRTMQKVPVQMVMQFHKIVLVTSCC